VAAAPGWYDDPHVPGGKRYWDGSQWTEHAAGPGQAAAPQAGAALAREPYPPLRITVAGVAVLFTVLLIVGSAGTWVSVEASSGAFHVGGSKGGLSRDGAITLGIAIICLILIGVWAARVGPPAARIAIASVTAFLGFLAIVICIADIADVESKGNSIVSSSAGWGLWLCLVASVGLTVTMLVGVAVRQLR
jgi:Protein of unknown function (DUF2510)